MAIVINLMKNWYAQMNTVLWQCDLSLLHNFLIGQTWKQKFLEVGWQEWWGFLQHINQCEKKETIIVVKTQRFGEAYLLL